MEETNVRRENNNTLNNGKENLNTDMPLKDKGSTRFLHNPLPGPKPHVKREMKYDYDVPADKMHFDIENPKNNSYDIN